LREHVGYNFTRFKSKFSVENVEAPKKYHYPEIYMEIDKPVDLKFVESIFLHFWKKKKSFFNLKEILRFLKTKKYLIKINNKVLRRWKALRKND